jgi:hypothetical protein
MRRILAIDWDRHEARAVLLASGPTGTAVAGAWAAPLASSENTALNGSEIGRRLAACMAGAVGGKATTLVGVGRDNVQMQLLALPPAPAEELPDLVRFQAEREFTALGSESALDFIPIVGDTQTPHQVLGVALNRTGLSEARDICTALAVQPDRIVLRACAVAALVQRAGAITGEDVALVVNPLAEEADLTVQAGDRILLMRTVRLPEPAQADARLRALVGEIRRTSAAARQQLADRRVAQVVVCGSRGTTDPASRLSAELEVAVTWFDPASHAPAGLKSHGVAAESLGRFAAVLGMALDEADRRPPVVDFANVRRRAPARRFARSHALAAVAAAVAVLWFAAHLWRQISDPASQWAVLENRIRDVQSQADKYADVSSQATAIQRWLATDVNWLDELEALVQRVRPQPLAAENFPVDDDVVVTQLTMLRPPGTDAVGGRIDLFANAKSDAAVRDLEQRLRTVQRRVTPGGVRQDKNVPGYPRALDLQIQVPPPDDDGAGQPAGAAP